ncbi:MAG: autotransporter outer membrane beta-barrel domain-containing protein, partial [Alphaproteobacteria bacterium]|nr:autotransporter outer membrane beta-barrel domain-containing protein [Alphaproteobacteria bacterium]
AHGIYIEKNATVDTVLNSGSIYVNGTEKGNAGITLNGADLRNESLLSFSGKANLNALDGRVYLEKGGTIEAQSLEGDLTLGISNVLGSNEDTYVAEGALQTEDLANLNLISESALFKAKATADGNTVLERESFDKFTPNASIAKYLTSNYEQGKLVEMYDAMKNQTEAQKARRLIAKDLGYDTMPNFADENFMALKSLNRNIADTILQPSDENYRVVAGADSVSLETKNKAVLSGYDLSASSMYTFGDKRLDNKNRLGLGLSFTKLSSSYDRGGDRDLNIVSLFIPYLHKFTDKLNLASILSFGYGYGDLERGGNKKADINDIFYGFTNELRYSMDLNGFASLEPALYLNAIGYTEDGLDEGSENLALETGRTHNLSIEAGVGLFLKKQVSLEKYGKLGFKIGGAYYRELGSPYDDIKARIKSGNRSWYRMNDYANIYTHDRALIEAMIDYEYKDLSIYAKFNQIIQKNNPKLFDLGIKYKF